MVSVRVATPGDVPVICQINVQSWQAAFRGLFPDEFLDSLDPKDREPAFAERLTGDPPHHAAVAIDGDVVGFVALGPPDDEDLDTTRVHEIWGLYVDPDHIGTGTGRILMDHAIDHLQAGGWDCAILWTLRDVDRTRRFYEAAGWYPDGGEKTWEIPQGNAVSLVRYRFDLH